MESMKAAKDLRPSWKCCGIAYHWFMSTLIKFSFFRNLSSKYDSSFFEYFYDTIIMILSLLFSADNIILCNKTIVYGSHDTAINASLALNCFRLSSRGIWLSFTRVLDLIYTKIIYTSCTDTKIDTTHARYIKKMFFFSSRNLLHYAIH